MGPCSVMATLLDQELLEVVGGVGIAGRGTPDSELRLKSGSEVSRELGGRYLLRYMLAGQLGRYVNGSGAQHYVTPTPYAPEETVPWLGLPAASEPRTHVMLLDPRYIPALLGPRWIRFGMGIEYLLPDGFPGEAVVGPGRPGAQWELVVR